MFSVCGGVFIYPDSTYTVLHTELEPTGGAHRCCTRLALAVGESTLVTRRVAKNDCDYLFGNAPSAALS